MLKISPEIFGYHHMDPKMMLPAGSHTVVFEEFLYDVDVLGRQGTGQSCLALRRELKVLRVEYNGDTRELECCKLAGPP